MIKLVTIFLLLFSYACGKGDKGNTGAPGTFPNSDQDLNVYDGYVDENNKGIFIGVLGGEETFSPLKLKVEGALEDGSDAYITLMMFDTDLSTSLEKASNIISKEAYITSYGDLSTDLKTDSRVYTDASPSRSIDPELLLSSPVVGVSIKNFSSFQLISDNTFSYYFTGERVKVAAGTALYASAIGFNQTSYMQEMQFLPYTGAIYSVKKRTVKFPFTVTFSAPSEDFLLDHPFIVPLKLSQKFTIVREKKK